MHQLAKTHFEDDLDEDNDTPMRMEDAPTSSKNLSDRLSRQVIGKKRVFNDPVSADKSKLLGSSKVCTLFLNSILSPTLHQTQTGGVVQWAVGSDNGLLHMPSIVYAETRKAKCEMFVKILTPRMDFHEKHPILFPSVKVPIRLVFTDRPTEAKNALEDAYEELKITFGKDSKWGNCFDCLFAYDIFHACHNLNAVALSHCDRRIAQQDFAFLLNLTRKQYHSHSASRLSYNAKLLETFSASENVKLFRSAIRGDKQRISDRGPRLEAVKKLILETGELSQW